MTISAEKLVRGLTDHLYTVLTDGLDENIDENQRERFLAWCLPGIPIGLDSLRFTTDFFKKAGPEDTETPDENSLLGQASDFARLVDFIPEVTGVYDAGGNKGQLVAFHRDGSSLGSVYERVLMMSQVAQTELTAEETANIKRFSELLTVQREKRDIVTNEVSMVAEPSPMVEAYNAHAKAYDDVASEFINARLTGGNLFALKGPMLRRAVDQARAAWASSGFKNEVEKIRAFIQQVTQRDLTLWKSDIQGKLESCRIGDPRGGEFFYTTMVPRDFWARDAGWTEYTLDEQTLQKHAESSSTSTNAAGGLSIGIVTLGGAGGAKNEKVSTLENLTNFTMKFKVAQIPILRPWLDVTFLKSKAWRMKEGEFLSNGERPPKGELPAYAANIIFAKDIEITANELSRMTTEQAKELAAKGGVGIGPFVLGGSHKRGSTTTDLKLTSHGQTLKSEGVQILAFRCHMLDKTPDPAPGITKWV